MRLVLIYVALLAFSYGIRRKRHVSLYQRPKVAKLNNDTGVIHAAENLKDPTLNRPPPVGPPSDGGGVLWSLWERVLQTISSLRTAEIQETDDVVKTQTVEKQSKHGILENWHVVQMTLRKGGGLALQEFKDGAVNDGPELVTLISICSDIHWVKYVKKKRTVTLKRRYALPENRHVILRATADEEYQDLHDNIQSEVGKCERMNCEEKLAMAEERLADYEAVYLDVQKQKKELEAKALQAETLLIKLQQQLEETQAKSTPPLPLAPPENLNPIPDAASNTQVEGQGTRPRPPSPRPLGLRPPGPRPPGPRPPGSRPLGPRPPGLARPPGPRAPGAAGPRGQGGPRVATVVPLGSVILVQQNDFITQLPIKIFDENTLTFAPMRELLDFKPVAPVAKLGEGTDGSAAEHAKGKKDDAKIKKLYNLEALKMRAVSIKSQLPRIYTSLGDLAMNDFVNKLLNKEEVGEVLGTLKDEDALNAWRQATSLVSDEILETASADPFLLDQERLLAEYTGLSEPTRFVQALIGKKAKLSSLLTCIGSISENQVAIDSVRATLADKAKFFSGNHAASVVQLLDEIVSNFLLALFRGMPPEEKKQNEYKKIDRQLKLATTTFAEPAQTALMPLLYVANILNSEDRTLFVRADMLNSNSTGKSSPHPIDLFLSFASANPVPLGDQPTFLQRLLEPCKGVSDFKQLLYTDGAAAQWYQAKNSIKEKMKVCKTTVPSLEADLTKAIEEVDEIIAQLQKIMKASVYASGSIAARLAQPGDTQEEELLTQAGKVAEAKLTTDAPEKKIYEKNELLDDGFLRNTLIQFCQKLSRHVPKIGTFRAR